MTTLARINRFISRLEDSLLIGLVAGLLLVAVTQIILRNVFGAGLLWADPAMRIALLWLAMVGGLVVREHSSRGIWCHDAALFARCVVDDRAFRRDALKCS